MEQALAEAAEKMAAAQNLENPVTSIIAYDDKIEIVTAAGLDRAIEARESGKLTDIELNADMVTADAANAIMSNAESVTLEPRGDQAIVAASINEDNVDMDKLRAQLEALEASKAFGENVDMSQTIAQLEQQFEAPAADVSEAQQVGEFEQRLLQERQQQQQAQLEAGGGRQV